MTTKPIKSTEGEISVEEKLYALYELQTIDSKIDEIRRMKGELPLVVQDLEDEITGLHTRIKNIEVEIKRLESEIQAKKGEIKESETQIKKYEGQQMKVRNNREYDSISKEIEFQNLEIQLSQKRIKEFQTLLDSKKQYFEESKKFIEDRNKDLEASKSELDSIIRDTKKDEETLTQKSLEIEKLIESRLLFAYKLIRSGARNGLAVVAVERDACGGCFNKIPPQRQLEVASRKKIIVCEYCGRILVDKDMANEILGVLPAQPK